MSIPKKSVIELMSMQQIGKRCKQYRQEHGFLQDDVAAETGYTSPNISAFETGRNDNAQILLWYFSKGMTYEYLTED